MMNAYDRNYLDKAMVALGRMLDYAVYDMKCELAEFWEQFIASSVSKQFEAGNPSFIAGRSGVELALMVTGHDDVFVKPSYPEEKSEEYWTGWALAYFQWRTCLSFSQINRYVPIDEVVRMYSPYHEMDIRQFCDRMSELYNERKPQSNLKARRLAVGLSQSRLAEISGVPLRTLQQYEQRQKDINKARAEYVVSLARALYCDSISLLECDVSGE